MGIKSFRLRKGNIRIGDYEKLSQDQKDFVDYTIKNSLKPNTRLRVGIFKKLKPKQKDFWQLSWNDMIMTWAYIENNEVNDLLRFHFGLKQKQFLKLNIFNAMACYKWILDQVKGIDEVMKAELHDEATNEEKAAGIDDLKRFDYTPTLKKLCNDDRTKYEWMLSRPFAWIFKEIALIKAENEYQRNYQEIVSRKTQRSVR